MRDVQIAIMVSSKIFRLSRPTQTINHLQSTSSNNLAVVVRARHRRVLPVQARDRHENCSSSRSTPPTRCHDSKASRREARGWLSETDRARPAVRSRCTRRFGASSESARRAWRHQGHHVAREGVMHAWSSARCRGAAHARAAAGHLRGSPRCAPTFCARDGSSPTRQNGLILRARSQDTGYWRATNGTRRRPGFPGAYVPARTTAGYFTERSSRAVPQRVARWSVGFANG